MKDLLILFSFQSSIAQSPTLDQLVTLQTNTRKDSSRDLSVRIGTEAMMKGAGLGLLKSDYSKCIFLKNGRIFCYLSITPLLQKLNMKILRLEKFRRSDSTIT